MHAQARRRAAGNAHRVVGIAPSMRPTTTHPDALSELLARLRFRARAVTIGALAAGHRRELDDGSAVVHHVLSGSASVSGLDACAIVRTGDVVLLPLGRAHTLTAIADSEILTGTLRYEGSALPRGAASVDLGAVVAPASILDGGLPELMMSCGLAETSALVDGLVRGIREEQDAGRSAASSLTEALATLIVAATVRSWAEQVCDHLDGGWQLALRDPDIARAVEAIQSRPGARWSVAGLARVANSSRSVFAEQFRLAVGAPPLTYLTRVRMERAKQLLAGDGLSVGQTATALGYVSDVAFSRAFRRHTGLSPRAWRQGAESALPE